ncbi:MAG: LamG-like jellyroll fold domain-containing protein [bacterium]
MLQKRFSAASIAVVLLAGCGDSSGQHIDGDAGVPPNDFVYDPTYCDTPPPDHAAVRELYVSAAGAADFATLQECVDQAEPGDHCLVEPGQYGRTEVVLGGTPDQWIVLRAVRAPSATHLQPLPLYDPADPVALPGNPAVNAVTRGFAIEASYVRVEGFEVTAVFDPEADFPGRGAIGLTGSSHVEVVGNLIHDANAEVDSYNYQGIRADGHDNSDILLWGNTLTRNQGTGISIFGTDWRIECNDISHTLDTNSDSGLHVGGDSDAIRFFGTGHRIRYNYIHDLLDEEQLGDPHIDAFQVFTVWPDSQYAHDIVIEGNYVYDSGQMLMSSDESESEGGEDALSDITFRGNVFRKTRAMAIIVASATDHFTFINNVVTEAWYTAISVTGGSHHVVVVNNIFYNNGQSNPLQPAGQALADEDSRIGSIWDYNLHYPDFTWPEKVAGDDEHGMYGVDPLFLDVERQDYRVIGSSPACGAGYEGADIGAFPCVRCADDTPIPYLRSTRRSGWEPLIVAFDGSYSLACGDNPAYEWDFDDGDTATGAEVTHVFGPGEFDVTLTVSNTTGASAIVTRRVSVEAAVLPNLVLGLHLDGDVEDWSGKGNVVAWVEGTGAYDAGISGQAAAFDGTEGSPRIDVDHQYFLDDLEQLSVSFWAQKNDPAASQEVLLKHTSYMLRVNADGFRGDVYSADDSVSVSADGLPNDDTGWHHYVLTYDGAAVTLYLDGAEVTTTPHTGRVARNVDRPVNIGGSPWGPTFDGRLDEVRIYDKALSAVEVDALYTVP